MDSTHWSVVPFFIGAGLINFALFLYVVIYLPRSTVNRFFALFIFLLGIAQLADGMMHLSATIQDAAMWQRMTLATWVFIAPIGVLMVAMLTQQPGMSRKSWLYPILILPALICQLMLAANLDQFIIIKSENWGWISNPINNVPSMIIYFYISAVSLLMPVILWAAVLRNRKNARLRNQFLLLSIGISVPYVGGVIAEVILPMTFGFDNVPLAPPLMTLFTVCAMIAIRKHRMLDYSPRHQFDRILDTMTEGVMIVASNGRIMYANPSLRHITGCDIKNLVGASADSILGFTPDQKPGRRELQLKHNNGEGIWVIVSTSPCLDSNGKVIGTTCIITNINLLKQTNAKIRRNEQRLKRAQEVAHVGSWELNFETGMTRWTDEACRIYGFPIREKTQSFETWVSLIHPEDLATVMLQIKKTYDTGSDGDFEHRIVLRDGTVKHIHSISKFEYDENNKPVGLFGICKDITEIKLAQQKLQATSRELETYIYKSSHDMHAPLASILGLVNVSRLEIFDPAAVSYLQMIESQAKKLDSVRAEFIKAMHIKDATKLDEEIHVNAMIGDILRDLRTKEGFSRLNIDINVAPCRKLVSNQFLMRTILQNLIENSIKYQNYSEDRPVLRIDLQHADNTTKIIIEDNGIGIDPSIHDKIFDMYFKSTESRNGSGLGLYLVRKAVEKLQGKLQLRSSPGQGTKVTLSFAHVN